MKKIITLILKIDTEDDIEILKHDLMQELECTWHYFELIDIDEKILNQK